MLISLDSDAIVLAMPIVAASGVASTPGPQEEEEEYDRKKKKNSNYKRAKKSPLRRCVVRKNHGN